jgi:hypothetical protein
MEEQDQTNIEELVLDNLPAVSSGPFISEEDKEKFFKSVLSDKPFIHTVDLFGGKMKITLRTMTVEENNDIVNQINKDKTTGVAEDNDAYFVTISTYRLGLCLVDIDGVPYQAIDKAGYKETEKGTTYIRARAEAMRAWPTFKLSAFLSAFNDFESKVVKLTSEVNTSNFWTASA